jgi:hypothetical protein
MKRLLCLLSIVLLHYAAISQADKKHDVITKVNGDELSGDVLEINDSTIRFTYTGEKLVYNIKKSEIQKITYASGRVENYATPTTAASNPTSSPNVQTIPDEERRNKVAILPFTFLKDGEVTAVEVSEEVQNYCYSVLSKHAGTYTVVIPRNSNVKLNQAGITKATIMNYTMSDICKIIGVEYIIDGMVSQNRTTESTSGNTNYNSKTKEDNSKSSNKSKSSSESFSSTTTQNYQTTIDMKIYNDKSDVIYNQNKKSFWSGRDAYKNTLEYLLKHSPLYTK